MKVTTKKFQLDIATMRSADDSNLKQTTSLNEEWTFEKIEQELLDCCVEDGNDFATASAYLYKKNGWTLEEVQKLLGISGEITDENEECFDLTWSQCFKDDIINKEIKKFREENKGKWIWYNGAMGVDNALSNNNIEKTREKAVEEMAWHDNVTVEEVENDYDNWYYILPVEEILDEYLIDFFENEA